ncbi:MAG: TonB-dependent receptor [Pseudomonadota bacterium]
MTRFKYGAGVLQLAVAFTLVPGLGLAEVNQFVNIPAQPLEAAISALGKETELRVAAATETLRGKLSNPVKGYMTPHQALKEMISGTGLETKQIDAGTFVVGQAAPGRVNDGEISLGQITVRGERVERSVYETASSVVVKSGQDIERTPGTQNIEDVVQDIPNVTNFGTSNFVPAIRGQNSNGPSGGGASTVFINGFLPRITVSVDGRPLSPGELIYGNTSVWDLSGVEVFRGPQTTAQGLNAIAGAIYIRTNDPTYEPETTAQVQRSSFDGVRGSGMMNIPIVPNQLAIRGAVDFIGRDVYVTNLTPGQIINGVDAKTIRQLAARVKLLWEPEGLQGFSNKTTFSYSDGKSPQREFADQPFSALQQRNNQEAVSWESGAKVVINDTEYEASDQITLKNQFSFSDFTVDRLSAVPGNGTVSIDGEDIINETTASLNLLDGRLTGVVGVVARTTDQGSVFNVTNFFGGILNFSDKKENFGVFSELTYKVTDRLDVTAGLRYQRDTQKRTSTPLAPIPAMNFNETFDAVLPRFVIAYDVSEDLRIGALASKGYNPGGVSVDFTSIFAGLASPPFRTYKEETLWNYEVFARASLMEDRLKVNANAFYTDIKDSQRTTTTFINMFPTTVIDNAERSESYGFEFSADYQATETFRAFGGFGLLGTEILKFSSDTAGRQGSDFEFAPAVTANFGFEWEIIPNVNFGMNGRYNDGYFSDDTNARARKVPAYKVFNMKLDYAPTENVKIFGFINNLFDERYVTNIQLPGTGPTGDVGKPFEVGGGVRIQL